MFCNHCSSEIAEKAKFCTSCGAKVIQSAIYQPVGQKRGIPEEDLGKFKSQRFQIELQNLEELLKEFSNWIELQNFKCQRFQDEQGRIILQIAKNGGWRKIIGMNTTVNVIFISQTNSLTVKVGAGKWLDKAVAGGVGIFFLWPLSITSGIGAYEQMKLPDKIFSFIHQFSNSN